MIGCGQSEGTVASGMIKSRMFIVCDAAGGIRRWGYVQEADAGNLDRLVASQALPGENAWMVSSFPDPVTAYVNGGVPTARPTCPIAAAVAGRVVTLTGVPADSVYAITGAATLSGVADATGRIAFTFGAAGTYQIVVSSFPFIDFIQEVTLP